MLFSIPPIEKEKAVQYLIDNIPAETLNDVATLMTEKGRDWWLDYHFSGGMGVRNLLMKEVSNGTLLRWMMCGLN